MNSLFRSHSLLVLLRRRPPRSKECQIFSRISPPTKRHASSIASAPRPRVPAQKSMRIAMQEQIKKGGMPNDVGLLAGLSSLLFRHMVLIMLKIPLSCPRDRESHLSCKCRRKGYPWNGTGLDVGSWILGGKLEASVTSQLSVKSGLTSSRLIIYKFTTKPRLKLRLRSTTSAAQALHTQMYTAFAE